MAPRTFECSICCESKHEDPTLIDGSMVCEECLKTAILPLFSNALEHEHNYPPKWGPIKLEVDDFAVLLTRHFGGRFLNRYHRREKEYQAAIRVYCKHKVDRRKVPKIGDICTELSKLALTPDVLDTYNAAGSTYIECGGFVSDRVHPPNTIIVCRRCNGRVCGACELPMHEVAGDDSHICKSVTRADTLQELFGQKRGRDLQQCPNNTRRNILGPSAGCEYSLFFSIPSDIC